VRLGVNIDHVATLRQQRFTKYPSPLKAALLVEDAGADHITVHLREDRRHIKEEDVRLIKDAISILLNLEMAATDEMVNFAIDVKPDIVCLVPEKRAELTTEGGLDIVSQINRIGDIVKLLQGNGIKVSLFIDPDKSQIDASKEIASYAIELHTGKYASAKKTKEQELINIIEASRYAQSRSLHVHAGHGLDYLNVKRISQIKEIEELNIGHSIVARAIFVGLDQAVKDMIAILSGSRGVS
jgi:pyridoxine 5-phosphate synthase